MVAAYLETAVLPVAERTASEADHAANKQVYWLPFDKAGSLVITYSPIK